MNERLLSGWGRTAPTLARVSRPADAGEVAAAVRHAPSRGVAPRGLGRAYGDAAQNAGGVVLDCTALTGWSLDETTGVVTAGAGVSLRELMADLVPRGWSVPVIPGTGHVTVGGAVAADVHGKNHHVDSSFGAHLRSLTLITADGGTRALTPADPLFHATVGGMGLTGVLVEAAFRCVPIETSLLRVDVERTPDLDHTLAAMEEGDHRYRYTVAWIDLLAGGARMGRGVLSRGDHLPLAELPRRIADPLAFRTGRRLRAPGRVPGGLLNPLSARAFNELWYRKPARRGLVRPLTPFFHPLDAVEGWNRLYGPAGFAQYQCALPFAEVGTLRRIVAELSGRRVTSFLAVLKRFGPEGSGLLSFPLPGWTLALDLPAGQPELAALLRRFDEWVVAAGGRLYLAKDSRLAPDLIEAMYPRLGRWREIRAEADPEGVFRTDLARRLRL